MTRRKKKKYHPIGVCMKPCKTRLGGFLRKTRLDLGLSQVQLAKQSGMDQRVYSRFEVGSETYLNPGRIKRLALALRCEPAQLEALSVTRRPKQKRPRTKLAKLIHSRREELELSRKKFAKMVRVSSETVRSMETVNSYIGSYSQAVRVARALKLDLSDLIKFIYHRGNRTRSNLGQIIRSKRKELGMSVSDLAKLLDMTKQNVSHIELGRTRLVRNDDGIRRFARALRIKVGELMEARSESNP